MGPVPSLITQLRPPNVLAGRLAIQSLLFAVGDGAFYTASAVFFVQIVGLTAPQVGVGITVGLVASFLVAVPAGKLADRIGPQRMWVIGAAGTASMFLVWPFINDFAPFLAMSVVLEVVRTAGDSGRGAYVLDVVPRKQRVDSRAYMYAALNLGFTAGAGLGGIALATNSDPVIRALPWLTAILLSANAYWISRLPRAEHQQRPQPMEEAIEQAIEEAVEQTVTQTGAPPVPGALRNPGFLLTQFFAGIMGTNQVLLTIVIPLWLVTQTDAPPVLLAFLFGTNTVMCVLLPMATARTVRDLPTALRATRISGAFFVGSCVITLFTHDTVGWLTISLIWLGHLTVTGAELFLSAAGWLFESELSDPARRGEYQGASDLAGTLGYVGAPALYTYLALEWGSTGWLIIGAIVAVAAVAIAPSTWMAQRFMERHQLDPAR